LRKSGSFGLNENLENCGYNNLCGKYNVKWADYEDNSVFVSAPLSM
jgi:hypothetical protein